MEDVPEPFEEEGGEEGGGGGSGRRTGAGITVQQMYNNVRAQVNARISEVGELLSGKVMSATGVVAEKIDDIAREASGECDRPMKDTDRHYVPPERLGYINRLRGSDPATFEKLRKFASKYASDDYEGDRNADAVDYVKKNLARPKGPRSA